MPAPGIVPDPPMPTRVDLHLHSRASTDTGSWFLSRAVLPESFVDPEDAYRVCKRRGMDLVAMTDHNTISGALEIAHHGDVIVGVEITTAFPGEAVQLHVLAWGVDERLWADLDRARGNVHDLLPILRAHDVPHALAHPLHRVGDDLTVEHLEQCLLMFPLWEGLNGARPAVSNEVGVRIAQSANAAILGRLAEKHGIEPVTDGPPALTGGSDDHSLLEAACAWTEMPQANDPEQVVAHLRRGAVRPGGAHGSSTALAHSVGTLLLKRYANDGAAAIPEQLRGPFADLISHPLAPAPASSAASEAAASGLGARLLQGARRDRRMRREFRRLGRLDDSPERSRARLRLISGWLHTQLMRSALDTDDFGLATIGRRIESLLAASAVAAPYCLAARWMRDEREHAVEFERDYFGAPGVTADEPVRAAVFTDTFDQINGAAGTLRRLAAWSAAQDDAPVQVVTTGDPADGTRSITRVRPIVDFPVPAYADSALRLGIPNLLDVLDAIDGSGARLVHAATPGPMGIAALLAARTLGLPFVASYHTELGDYAMQLTGDRVAAGLTRNAVRWFYSQAQRVYVPTRATADRLMADGIDPERLHHMGRGIDTEAFGPRHRRWWMRQRMAGRGSVVVLYVGRISREKGLDVLAAAFRRASASNRTLRLVLVGDGPYRGEMERLLQGSPHRFMGPLTGDALSSAYAGADMFCLPSATETYGQVVVEAAVSGLPVIVTDAGGARESVDNGRTGLVVPADDADALCGAMLKLGADETGRNLMGAAGRAAALQRGGWDEVFAGLVGDYTAVLSGPRGGLREQVSASSFGAVEVQPR